MSEEDKELERLKNKRLKEMQKNLSIKQKHEESISSVKNKPKPRELLVRNLGYRGMEVLQNAEAQFPDATKVIVEKLGELISSGEIDEKIDGGQLLALFRSVGVNVRVQTTINVERDGKFVSISEKLSKTSDDNSIENPSENNNS